MTVRLVVEADGGSRGNPGVAGYGALVRDADSRQVLAERAAPLGKESNNVAEYSGLIAGLEAAAAIDPSADVEVRMDSKLVIEQMSGRWKIKHEDMRRLALEARELCSARTAAGGSVSFTWIPRAENKAADKLSNDGMDGHTVDRRHDAEPAPSAPATTATSAVAADTSEPDLSPPTRVLLVRHGVTEFTTRGKLDGRGGEDPGLSAQGRDQAGDCARGIRALVGRDARLVTSGLYRARQTGEIIGERLGLTPATDDRFDEQGFGDWDGKSMGQIAARWPDELTRLRSDTSYARPGGESHDQLRERVLAGWADLIAAGGTIVLVAHRMPFLVVLGELLGLPHDRLQRLALAPGSLTGIEVWRDGNASVSFVNRTDHL